MEFEHLRELVWEFYFVPPDNILSISIIFFYANIYMKKREEKEKDNFIKFSSHYKFLAAAYLAFSSSRRGVSFLFFFPSATYAPTAGLDV